MFKAKVRPEVLKEVVDIVSTLVDEAKITTSKTGIGIKAVDPAHVAMIELSLGKGGFEEFKADDIALGVDIDKIKEVRFKINYKNIDANRICHKTVTKNNLMEKGDNP